MIYPPPGPARIRQGDASKCPLFWLAGIGQLALIPDLVAPGGRGTMALTARGLGATSARR